MGEYATYNGQEVKIGTCESMYYLRYEDRHKVKKLPSSLNPAACIGLFWRLPFPDEDGVSIGHYDPYNRGERLIGFTLFDDDDDPAEIQPGIIQLSHKNGLLLNVPCYHGFRLPDVVKPMQAFWNGFDPNPAELAFVKNHEADSLLPLVRCRWCDHMWRCEWENVLPHVHEEELRKRLEAYRDFA